MALDFIIIITIMEQTGGEHIRSRV